MRFLEVIIILGLFIYHLGFVFKINNPKWVLVPGVLILTMFFHLFLEGYRWQMWPVYLLNLTVFFVSFRNLYALLEKSKVVEPPFFRFNWLGAFGILALIIGSALCYLFPVFKIPAPGGHYAVGTSTMLFEDENRQELITADPDDYRSFMVRLWYPAENQELLSKAPYIHPKIASYIAKQKAPLPFFLSHFNLIKTNSLTDAQISESKTTYPVLIFSHGYESHPSMYFSFAEELASHGYIVLFINHTYESSGTVFPDGTVALTDTAIVRQSFDWSKIKPYYDRLQNAKTKEEKTEATFKALKAVGLNQRVRYWAKDVTYLIDNIFDDNSHITIKEKMDRENLGIIGHSVGGALAVEMLMKDERIKVGINMDGGQYGEVLDSAVHKPFMYIQGDRSPPESDPNPLIYEKIIRHDFIRLKLFGASHTNFYEVAYWSKLKALTGAGDIDPKTCFQIANRGILLFFDHYLNGKNQKEFHAELKKIQGVELEIKLKQ